MLQPSKNRLLTAALITTVLLTGCQHDTPNSSAESQAGPETRLVPTLSAGQLESYIKAGLSRNNQASNYSYDDEIASTSQPTADAVMETSASAISGTNLQISGVDESDRIKNDNEYLYSIEEGTPVYAYADAMPITANTTEPMLTSPSMPTFMPPTPSVLIHQIQADPAASNLLGEITFDKSVNYINGLYLTTDDKGRGEQLIAVTKQNSGNNSWYDPWAWQAGQTQLLMYDVTDPNSPELNHTINIDGHLIDSRRIKNKLYLVTRFTASLPQIDTPLENGDHQISDADLSNISLEELLPDYSINEGEIHKLVSEKSCFLPEERDERYGWPTLTSITAINLDNPEEINSICYGGHADGLFATPQSIYLTTTSYASIATTDTISSSDITSRPEISIPKTAIHKFALTENGPNYRGTGVVPGSLISNGTGPSFLMGESGDVLHIITSWREQNDINHQLNNLKENSQSGMLDIIATLPNDKQPAKIGKPGEMIYAARYIGDRAYIVTFQKVDPLYIIDLTNETQPRIAGELEIPGYSSYLHAVNENLLLGIGKETIASEQGTFSWFQGLKLSLFNVADISNPQEIKVLNIGKRGTNSPILNNSRALTYLHGKAGKPDRFTLPVQFHEGTQRPEAWAQHDWQHNGLYLFEIDESTTANLTHTGTMISQQADANNQWGDSIYDDRAVIQGNAVHYIHKKGVLSADWDAVTP